MEHKYIPRLISQKLKELFAYFPVVIISGARQVGKSTLLEHTFPKIERVVFDPIVDIEGAKTDPDLFLRNRPAPIILDEIQYVPKLVPTIKRQLEKKRKNSQFLITGSQQWEVMRQLAESLAGRAVFIDLDGFNLLELARNKSKESWLEYWLKTPKKVRKNSIKQLELKYSLYEQIWRGFLPETYFLPKNLIADYLLAYERTYIERDIRLMAEISNLSLFSKFFRLCAALTAQEINFSELGRELGITPQTSTRWLELLKSTFQWLEIPAYSGNTIKRLSNKPKGYISDPGLACFALAISTPETLGGHPKWGSIFESAVVSEIKKQCRLLPSPPNLYHWRTHGGAEVDLILEIDNKFYPIEIKGKSHPTKSDASGIAAFRKTYPNLNIQKGLIIAASETFYDLADDLAVMPWNACF